MNREKLVIFTRNQYLQCPLCKTSLISPTNLGRLSKMGVKVKSAEEALQEARKPKAGKKKGWIVGGWCSS